MDFFAIKEAVLILRRKMIDRGYRFDGAILFGSYAKGTAHAESDIDLGILSRDFGKNRIAEGAMLNSLLYYILPQAEAVPISIYDYIDPMNISPLLHEIKKTGKIIV